MYHILSVLISSSLLFFHMSHKPPHQLLRKRFLYGEQVECYLNQEGLPKGWFQGYVLKQKPNAVDSSTRMGRNKSQRHVGHCTSSIYEVFLRGIKGGLRSQKVQVPSYCLRKLLGFTLQRIFPNHKRASRRSRDVSSEDADQKELSKFLRKFREGVRASDKIMVAVMEGVPLDQQSFRRAICSRAPGTCLFGGIL